MADRSLPSLSIIVASKGRATLLDTLRATRTQMRQGDELLISIQDDCPWGHRARNQLMGCARGFGLMFIDDDDVHTPDALDLARQALAAHPDRHHLFRMRYRDGRTLWQDKAVRIGNVSTQMIVTPRLISDPAWGERYEGDFDFIAKLGLIADPVWHDEVIALIRP